MRSASYPFGAPQWGCPLRVPQASVLGCVRCGGFACVNPVTDASGFPYRLSCDRGPRPVHRGCFVWTPTPPLLGRRTPRLGPARVCVCVPCLARSGGPASRARFGAPHLSFGRSWFALCLFGPLRAGVAPFVVVVGFFFSCFFSPSAPRSAPVVSCFTCFPALGALGLGVLSPPPFFFPLPPLCAPRCLLLCVFSGLGCPWPWCLVVPPPLFFFFFAPSPFPCCLWRFLLSGCLRPLRPPSPLFFFLGFLFFLFPFFFPFLLCRLCGAGQVSVS